jgi:RNA-directed DNA polymerase
MAVVQILQPIFEADFEDCSYGFRPGRSAKDALVRIREEIRSGRDNIYDADLKGYFDSIPHDKLLACVRMRVTDRNLLNLIKLWLRTPIVEYNEDKKKWTQFPPSDRGTPQGGVISPLLANLYLHWFDKAFHMPDGPAFWANARMVRYADDFVIMARYVNQRIMGWVEQKIESWMDLTINKEKSKVVNLRNGETLDFLGYSYRMVSDRFGRKKKYLELAPSKKAVQKEKENLKAIINSSKGFVPLPDLVSQVNRQLVGWKEYFKNGYPRKAFRDVNNFVRQRFASHLRRRSQRRYRPSEGVSFYKTMEKQGLVYL